MNATVSFESKRGEELIIGKDGNQFTATKHNFECLTTDPCGFGDTPRDAIQDLCIQLHWGVPMDIQLD